MPLQAVYIVYGALSGHRTYDIAAFAAVVSQSNRGVRNPTVSRSTRVPTAQSPSLISIEVDQLTDSPRSGLADSGYSASSGTSGVSRKAGKHSTC
jgi:hypothetical protein